MVAWSTADIPDQTGRTAVVTGANSGLGREVARALAGAGATVIMACRNLAKAEEAAADIRRTVPGARLDLRALDLADQASVAAFAEGCATDPGAVDLLVNNAGVMATDLSRTADGFEMQIGVNHLGHHTLTARLLPLMDRPGSRVGTMASVAHWIGNISLDDLNWERRRYQRWAAYGQSKLANLLFTVDLQRRLEASGSPVLAVAAHPGYARTELGQSGTGITTRLNRLVMPVVTQPAAAGALPMLRALTDPKAAGGQYWGPRFFAYGGPVRESPSPRAHDRRVATSLAALTAEVTGVELPA